MEQCRFPNPEYLQAQTQGRNTKYIPKYITNFSVLPNKDLLIPRGMLNNLKEICGGTGDIITTIEDKRSIFNFEIIDPNLVKYRPYQETAVANLILGGSEGLIVSPAGSGKTIMGLSLIPELGQPTLWLTHTKVLARQTADRAKNFVPGVGEIGFIGEGKWSIGKILTIAMIQTLIRNPDRATEIANNFGMVILDECHHCPARTFLVAITMFNPYYLYGLTATPYRADKLEKLMFQSIGPANAVVTLEDIGTHSGIILPKVIHRSVNGQPVDGNDIQKILRNNIMLNSSRNNMIVSDVLHDAKAGHNCIVVSDRKRHCEMLFKVLKERWPKTGIATGKYTTKQVKEQVSLLMSGEINVLVATTSLLGEGFDAPHLDRAFLCMPFRAEAKLEQLLGRIQRPYKNKTDAILYDYVDENVGILRNQFYRRYGSCRCAVYNKLGIKVEK